MEVEWLYLRYLFNLKQATQIVFTVVILLSLLYLVFCPN